MSLEQTACEDLKAFERRLTEVIACLHPSTTRWRIVLLGVSMCVATGASQWILDPETRIVSLSQSLTNHPFFILSTIVLLSLSQSLTNHPFFILSTIVLLVILLLGVHKRVIAASIITSRTREVLGDFNMSCDDSGKLILRPRPTNIT